MDAATADFADSLFEDGLGPAMEYEIFLYRADGALSAVCHASYASDRHAAASAQSLSGSGLGRAAIWQDERTVPALPARIPRPTFRRNLGQMPGKPGRRD